MNLNLILREYLKGAYVHPAFQKNDIYKLVAMDEEQNNPILCDKVPASLEQTSRKQIKFQF
jgi:hypothetical protein